MKLDRLNQYRIMWVFVYFDLPTQTKKQRKDYSTFRKQLLTDGFAMIQYSIYARHCSSRENADVHKKRVKRHLPPHGEIIVFEITDKQFGMMEFYSGKKIGSKPDTPQQLELF
jgi:CRISPR-associated protein Cas2